MRGRDKRQSPRTTCAWCGGDVADSSFSYGYASTIPLSCWKKGRLVSKNIRGNFEKAVREVKTPAKDRLKNTTYRKKLDARSPGGLPRLKRGKDCPGTYVGPLGKEST